MKTMQVLIQKNSLIGIVRGIMMPRPRATLPPRRVPNNPSPPPMPKTRPTTTGWKKQKKKKKKPKTQTCNGCGINYKVEIEFDGKRFLKKASAVLGVGFVLYKAINKIRK